MDHLYGLLLTFGLALIIQGLFRNQYGSSGLPYAIPGELRGGYNLGFMACRSSRLGDRHFALSSAWHLVPDREDQARLLSARRHREPDADPGARHQRAALGDADLRLRRGAGRRFTGVLAPIYSVNPNMGADLLIVVFAVVVIGGMARSWVRSSPVTRSA